MTRFVIAPQPWMAQARCAGWHDFTEMDVLAQVGECRQCPVQTDCAEYGLDEPIVDKTDTVVWGGMTPRERWELKRLRSRLQVVRS